MAENIGSWINEHFMKALWAIVGYFLYSVATNISEINDKLSIVLTNQAVLEQRVTRNEEILKIHSGKFDAYDEARTEFYKTYKLEKK